jgi:hypothetical protein
MPVRSLRLETGQWRELPAGGGPVTQRVAKAYKDFAAAYVRANANLRLL